MERKLQEKHVMLVRLIITSCLLALAPPCWAEGQRSRGCSIPPLWTFKSKAPRRPSVIIRPSSRVKVTIRPAEKTIPTKRAVTPTQTLKTVPKKLSKMDQLCRRFQDNRRSLDNDRSIQWVEGWHGVRAHNVNEAVPGIVADQGLFVAKSVSFTPEGAYWHGKKPATPQYWTNSGALVHFRVPKVYLETQGKHVNDASMGQRFKHEGKGYPPHSKTNPNMEILPVQVLGVYWVKGSIPQNARGIGTDLRDKTSWPQ